MTAELLLFFVFFRIGLFSFGGGYAMLPLIFHQVQQFGIMTPEEFSQLVAISQVTPGPIAVNAATYVGFSYAGFTGAFFATVAVALPSGILVIIAMNFLEKFQESRVLHGVFSGIRPATVGLIGAAAVFLSESTLVNGSLFSFSLEKIKEYVNLLPFLVFICTIILAVKFRVGPIRLIIMAGLLGALVIR